MTTKKLQLSLKLCIQLTALLFTLSANAETWYGTAFAIGDGYTYVTNNHVSADAKTICFRTPNGSAAKAKVINTDKSDDLTILRANVYSTPLQIGTYQDIKKGMSVLTIGYPVPNIMGLESKVTEGLVNSLSGAGGDTRRIQISAPIQPGNSGGPLFDENGNVIGVVVSRLGRKFTEMTGQYADSVGYAINISRLRALIETTPVLPNYIKPSTQRSIISRPKLVNMAEGSVMLVVASDKRENCSNDTDAEIPEFGTQPKTKAQLEKEREEIKQIALARVESERREAVEKERLAALSKQIEEQRKNEEIEKVKRERDDFIKSLSNTSKFWEKIDISPGFYYWKLKNGYQENKSLMELSNKTDAINILSQYINELPKENGIVQDKDFYTGSLCDCGIIRKVDHVTGYAIGEALNEKIVNESEIIVFNTNLGLWQKYKVEKWKNNQFSFSITRSNQKPISETSKVYFLKK